LPIKWALTYLRVLSVMPTDVRDARPFPVRAN
jgi:hypothetical protein